MTYQPNQYGVNDLLYLMERLRNPDIGCAWDLKQTFNSIVPHTIEETYEVVDAIARQDWPHVREELGDLLFQVVFYSQLGKEQALFDWPGVVHDLVTKLIRRHPHVFPMGTLESMRGTDCEPQAADIKQNWERIKKEEKALNHQGSHEKSSSLDGIPPSFPGLIRAKKLQLKAASVGFDWKEITPVFAKVREELTELEEEIQGEASPDRLEDELGDLLFCCVNLSRFLHLDPEAAICRANQKFEQRFKRVEELVHQQGKSLQETDVSEMDKHWDHAKSEGL